MSKNHEPKQAEQVEPKTYTQQEAAAEYQKFVDLTGWQVVGMITAQEMKLGNVVGLLNVPQIGLAPVQKQEPPK